MEHSNLRFDDTNPMKEKTEFVESIVSDVEWLGAKYDGDIKFASNYFDSNDMKQTVLLINKKESLRMFLEFSFRWKQN